MLKMNKKWEMISNKNLVEMIANDMKTLIKEKYESRTQTDEDESSKQENSVTHDI